MSIRASNNPFPHDPEDNFGDKLDRAGYEGTAQDLKNQIEAIANPDAFLSVGVINKVGNDVTIAANQFSWRIEQLSYVNADFSTTIVAAADGYRRIDIIVATKFGTLVKIQGDESIDSVQEPATPPETLRLTFFNVFGADIQDPDPPFVGENFVQKKGNDTIFGIKSLMWNSLVENESAVDVERQYQGIAVNKVATLNLINKGEFPGGNDYQNETNLFLQAGLTHNHRRYVGTKNFDGTISWLTGANAQNSWILYDATSGLHRYWNNTIADGGDTYISSAGTGRIYLNLFNDGGTGNGTGGIYVGSGGTSPQTVWKVDNSGRMTSPANITTNLRFSQTLGGTFTDPGSSSQGGLYSSVNSSPASNGSGNVLGGILRAVHNTAFTGASVTGISGVGRAESSGGLTILAGGDFMAQNAGTGTMSGAYGVRAGISTASGNTITNGYGYYALSPSGAGSIVNYRGFRALDATGTSFTAGYESNISAGATKWNFYAPGTAKNHFNGPVLTGTATHDGVSQLQVVGTASFSSTIIAGTTVRLKSYTVSALPAGSAGDTACVTDASSPVYLSAVTGGGSVFAKVLHNGTAWIVN